MSIEYTDSGRDGYRDGAPILSWSLPSVAASQPPAVSRVYLEGLLPEGRALAAAARLRGVGLDLTGAPATPGDVVALLAEYGRECAGAVTVMPADEGPPGPGHHGKNYRTVGGPAETVIDTIRTRVRRLESGERLGGPRRTPRRASGTLDQISADRRR